MSENQPISLQIIEPNQSIPISVSTDLYIRIQQCLLEGFPWTDVQHFQSVLKAVKDKTTGDPLTYHTETLLVLLSLVEASAQENKLITTKSFDPLTQKITDT